MTPPTTPPTIRTLILALIAVTALLIASWTAFLVWVTTQQPVDAILQSGVAFAGTVALCRAVWAAYRQR